jgi:hypothetical protein
MGRIKKIHFAAFLFLIFYGMHSFFAKETSASETDNFMAMDQEIQDSSDYFNQSFNSRVEKILARANKRKLHPESCHSLAMKIAVSVGSQIKSHLRGDSFYEESIDRYPRVHQWSEQYYFHHSIFSNSPGILLLAPTISVGGIHMGGDKISHAYGLGLVYYLKYRMDFPKLLRKAELAQQKNQRGEIDHQAAERQAQAEAEEKLVDFGIYSEKKICGLTNPSTQVFSYADLEANYQGFKMFWSLCHGEQPRLEIHDGKWVNAHPVDINEYVGPYWDEAYYLNDYTEKRWKQVKEKLKGYCGPMQSDPKIRKLFSYYDSRKEEKSFSVLLLEKRLSAKQVPDPLPHSVYALCPELKR